MRPIDLSQLSADISALPDFVHHLQEANDLAEVGFLFEEGGCYGMAIALHAKLSAVGRAPQIVVWGDGHHAFVLLDGWLLDYRGAQNIEEWSNPLTGMTPREMKGRALGRWKADDLTGDIAVAEQVIAAAIDLAQNHLPLSSRS